LSKPARAASKEALVEPVRLFSLQTWLLYECTALDDAAAVAAVLALNESRLQVKKRQIRRWRPLGCQIPYKNRDRMYVRYLRNVSYKPLLGVDLASLLKLLGEDAPSSVTSFA